MTVYSNDIQQLIYTVEACTENFLTLFISNVYRAYIVTRASLNPIAFFLSCFTTRFNEPVWALSKLSSSINRAKSETLAGPFRNANIWISRDQCTFSNDEAPSAKA